MLALDSRFPSHVPGSSSHLSTHCLTNTKASDLPLHCLRWLLLLELRQELLPFSGLFNLACSHRVTGTYRAIGPKECIYLELGPAF